MGANGKIIGSPSPQKETYSLELCIIMEQISTVNIKKAQMGGKQYAYMLTRQF